MKKFCYFAPEISGRIKQMCILLSLLFMGMAGFINFALKAESAILEDPDEILGVWQNKSNKGHVEIYKEDNKYYGKVVWLSEPVKNGKPRTDIHNPNINLRNRPVMGLVMLRNFEYAGKKTYKNGRIYDPESGREYKCEMKLINHTTLDVKGYIGITLLGRKDTWTRRKE